MGRRHGVAFGVTPGRGVIGAAAAFDGDGDFVNVPSHVSLESDFYTVAFWFRKTDTLISDTPGKVDVEGLVWKAPDTGLDRTFSFTISNQRPPFDCYMKIGNGSRSLITAIKKGAVMPGRWYHVAGSISGTHVALHIDGALVDRVAHDGVVVRNRSPVVFGKTSSSGRPERHFTGLIDEVVLYRRILSDKEVYELYRQGIGGRGRPR